jgi:hypothetical protein
MLLFLLQDSEREHPVGFENHRRNIFDPEEDDMPVVDTGIEPPPLAKEQAAVESTVGGDEAEEDEEDEREKIPSTCSRHGCMRSPRFDSSFCSDSCGVSALEADLLRTFQYASDIHPSLLRN